MIAPTSSTPGAGSRIAAAASPMIPAIAITATGTARCRTYIVAELDRHALRPIRMVDLLGERLDRVEPGDEQRDAGHDHERRGAAPGAVRAERRRRHRARRRARPARSASAARLASPAASTRARAACRAGAGTTGVGRDRSCASWRCRTITVRRSWIVAAKRSAPTRPERRSAASIDVPPMPSSPTTGIASAISTPRTAIGRTTSGQNASAPSIDAGEVIVPAKTSSERPPDQRPPRSRR